MTADDRRACVEWLVALGVPTAFHDPIIDAPRDRMTFAGGVVFALAVVAIVVGAMVAAFLWLDSHVQARAATLAAQTGASLAHVNVGLGPVVLLFGLIGLMGWVGSVVSGRYRVRGFLSSAAAMFNMPPPQGFTRSVTRWGLAGSVRQATSRATTVDGFLRAVAADQARKWGSGAVVLLTLALVLTALETNNFWVAGPSGIVAHRMLPPFSSRRYDLKDVTAVTTGCNAGKDNYLIYVVHLASGESFDLGHAEPAKSGDIRAIEAIDAMLARDIEHRRWSHLNRDPLHPACLAHWSAQFDKDGLPRLVRLLRITPAELREASFRSW